jgi:hypothetical protein
VVGGFNGGGPPITLSDSAALAYLSFYAPDNGVAGYAFSTYQAGVITADTATVTFGTGTGNKDASLCAYAYTGAAHFLGPGHMIFGSEPNSAVAPNQIYLNNLTPGAAILFATGTENANTVFSAAAGSTIDKQTNDATTFISTAVGHTGIQSAGGLVGPIGTTTTTDTYVSTIAYEVRPANTTPAQQRTCAPITAFFSSAITSGTNKVLSSQFMFDTFSSAVQWLNITTNTASTGTGTFTARMVDSFTGTVFCTSSSETCSAFAANTPLITQCFNAGTSIVDGDPVEVELTEVGTCSLSNVNIIGGCK